MALYTSSARNSELTTPDQRSITDAPARRISGETSVSSGAARGCDAQESPSRVERPACPLWFRTTRLFSQVYNCPIFLEISGHHSISIQHLPIQCGTIAIFFQCPPFQNRPLCSCANTEELGHARPQPLSIPLSNSSIPEQGMVAE